MVHSRGRESWSGSRRTRSGSSAGQLNASVNCVDRHVRGPRRNKAAIIWEGEPGDRRTLTYLDLHRQVCKFANVLKALGVKYGRSRGALHADGPGTGDRHAGLRPHRRGALVVFGGFGAESLRDRIHDAATKVLVTADGGFRRGQVVPLKETVDEALKELAHRQSAIVVKRAGRGRR